MRGGGTMRELKFRAWGNNIKEYMSDANGAVDVTSGLGDLLKQGNWTIEQYTGLKDKNGKEIYEGDILREKGLLSLTYLEWDKNNARYITKVLDKSKCVSATFYFDVITALECEVIGNIHENPELLEDEE
jgi:uncharacterized phage protein (TIGR01671 family)